MKKWLILIIPILAFVFTIYYLTLQQSGQGGYSSFTINNTSFAITYTASNYTQWTKGLMNNTNITNATTMLFVFPRQPGIWPFWMMDTYSNLDIFWVNASGGIGKVVYIAKNATSCFSAANCTLYTPNAQANYVIEAKAGFAARNNVVVGSAVKLK